MSYRYLFDHLVFDGWTERFLPDFVLAVAFFTSLIFAVLSHRFSKPRSAAVASLAMGLALSTGLIWWEAKQGYSIKDLGPLAVGFAMLLLGAVMYRAIRQIGGSWAGGAITFGVCLLIGWAMGVDWPVEPEIIQTITTVALLVGILAFVGHRHEKHDGFPRASRTISTVRNDMRDRWRDRHLADRLTHDLHHARQESTWLGLHPEVGNDIMLQLRRMLPAEGHLTARLARLRERAHHMAKGHCARIEETHAVIAKLPAAAKRKVSLELAARYKELSIDLRLERLDRVCAENERRIRVLTQEAQRCLQVRDHRKIVDILDAASKLQAHNARLLKAISRTEHRLITAARKAARRSHELKDA